MIYVYLSIIILFAIYFIYKTKRFQDFKNSNSSINCEKLFDNFNESLIVLDKKNEVIRYNDHFLKEFKISGLKLAGKKIDDIITIKEPESKISYIEEKLKNGELYKGKLQLVNKNNDIKNVNLKAYPIFENQILKYKLLILEEMDSSEINLSSKLRESRRKIRDLHQTSLKMEKVHTPQEVYNLTVKAAENILDFDLCTLDIVKNDKLVVKATSSNITNGESISFPIDSKSLSTYVYKNKQSVLSKNIQDHEFAEPTSEKYHSALTIPVGDRGVFQAVSTKIDDFTREDLELIELLIAHTVSALNRLDMNKKIRYLGFHDHLTGLYNRHFLNEEIDRIDTKRQLPISVIIGDLNGLKLINDVFGHEEGDEFLKKASLLLKSCLREEDILGRWGGDEFMILLPQTSEQEADEIMNRIKYKTKKTHKDKRPISVALGRATKDIDFKKSFSKIIEKADYRMYKNKNKIRRENKNPIIKMIEKKLGADKLNKGEIYRLDNLSELF